MNIFGSPRAILSAQVLQRAHREQRRQFLETHAFHCLSMQSVYFTLKHSDYASCCLSRVGQWCSHVGAPFPLQTHFASRMKYSSYLSTRIFFFFLSSAIPLQDYTSFFPDIQILPGSSDSGCGRLTKLSTLEPICS